MAGPSIDRLAVTKAITSVQPDHPELVAARAVGIVPESVQQIVADAAATGGRRLIGVTGTHGKSTTSGWLLHLLVGAGRDPSGFVGANLPASIVGPQRGVARFGSGPDFVVEADEYAGQLRPVSPGHRRARVRGMGPSRRLPRRDRGRRRRSPTGSTAAGPWTDGGRTLVANVGDRGVRRVLAALERWDGRRIAVHLVDERQPADDAEAGAVAAETGRAGTDARRHGSSARTPTGRTWRSRGLRTPDHAPDRVRLRLIGRHLAIDGLMAAGGALAAGVGADDILAGLASFEGVGRRFELKGEVGGVTVLDDYAHHPTAMRLTFGAARQRYPGRRLWAVYEPLTFHRTAAMLDRFADVLAEADRAAIIDIWAVRDPDTTITSAQALADATSRRGPEPAVAIGSPEAGAAWLADHVEPGDVVLVMGGGRSYVAAEQLVERLRARVRPS